MARWGWKRWPIAAVAGVGLLTLCAHPVTQRGSQLTTSRSVSQLIGHAGQFLTDADGQVVTLHGLDMAYKLAPYEPAAAGFGSVAAEVLASNGFDVVRLGVFYSALEPRPGVLSASYLNSIATTVGLLAHDGVYSILDFHQDQLNTEFGGDGFPRWSVLTNGLPVSKYKFPLAYALSKALNAAFDNIWADKAGPGTMGLQERYAAAWHFVAQHFATDPWVLGYDLFNEPWPGSSTDAALGAFYQRVIAAVRAADPNHLIFYEPYLLFEFGETTSLPPLKDSRLGMSFHDYCPEQAPTHPTQCASAEKNPIHNALVRSALTRDALVMTEFGATADLSDLANVVSLGDAARLSWVEWNYCYCHDPTSTQANDSEGLVVNPALPATGSNVDAAKLAVLAEPYPRLVAGTPTSYSFNSATKTYNLSYSTKAPGGKVFPAGACTAVLVPSVQYPTGYAVTVSGADVTSPPDAGTLTLAAKAGVTKITVVLSPASGASTTPPSEQALAACR